MHLPIIIRRQKSIWVIVINKGKRDVIWQEHRWFIPGKSEVRKSQLTTNEFRNLQHRHGSFHGRCISCSDLIPVRQHVNLINAKLHFFIVVKRIAKIGTTQCTIFVLMCKQLQITFVCKISISEHIVKLPALIYYWPVVMTIHKLAP